jgi:branched-chain amino acid transport system ATP-binding protein/branched-chain amino acid transport system permease protein
LTYWIDVLNQALIFGVFALSLNLLMGYAGQVSIAHAAFGAVGGYLAGYLAQEHGWAFGPALALGVAAALVFGLIVSLPALWLAGEYLILLTLSVQIITLVVITSIAAFGGLTGLSAIPGISLFGSVLLTPQDFLKLLVPVLVLVFLLMRRVAGSPAGRVLRGIREDELATQSLGKDVFAYKSQVFALTAGLAGLAGVLLVYYNGVVAPGMFGFSVSMTIIVMVIVGGSANLYGTLVGTALVVASGPFFQKVIKLSIDKSSLAQLLAYGVALVAVLRWRPQGLVPEGVTPGALVSWLRRRGGAASRPPAREPAAQPGRLRIPPTARLLEDGPVVALEAKGLSKSFGGIRAVEGLDLSLERGQITGLIGPNGAGKTTVFNLLTGALKPDHGTVLLGGREISGLPPHRIARAGMVRSFQDVRTFARLSVLENVMMGVSGQRGERMSIVLSPVPLRPGDRRTRDRALEWLDFVGLAERANEPAGSLAFGEQKLVALARVLATDAEVLLLDEPASGIDKRWSDHMIEHIARLPEAGRTVCIVEHNLNVVQRLAQKICFMHEGSVTAEGTMAELSGQERLQEAYFGSMV